MNQYQIFKTQQGSLEQQTADIKQQLDSWLHDNRLTADDLRYCKVFLSDILNQYDTLKASPLYRDCLAKRPCTIIEQAPADGSKIALLAEAGHNDDGFRFQSLRLSDGEAQGVSSYLQTLTLFERYIQSLKGTDMSIRDNLVRTWIYVADIDVNYDGVVQARNDVFRRYGLTTDTHYVASTGIGGYSETRHATVAIDFLSLPGVEPNQLKYLQALDHLNPTREYGVAFERGTRLTLPNREIYYISGTASIDKQGQVLYLGDVERQTARLLENIRALLADGGAQMGGIRYFVVYLRDFADRETVGRYLDSHHPGIPYVLLHAKVCRPQWLVEMECIAEKDYEQ
uniref:Rid family hydrolase n=1 Tax=Prevotella sp. TaxID=59823 RepID=UPI004027FF42